jgi:hypothetical protein
MRRLSPLQRAYWLGYRRGLNRALAKMACKAQAWEDEIAVLQADYETLINEVRCARDERAVEQGARAQKPGRAHMGSGPATYPLGCRSPVLTC